MAESAGPFDPYHKWLGIPPREQPPHHYRLLGLDLFESDEEVIESAARRLIAFCEQNSQGPHAAAARRVVFEIAAARLCLLDPEKRAEYDTQLKARQAATRTSAGVGRSPTSRAVGKAEPRSAPPPARPVSAPAANNPQSVAPPSPVTSDPFDFTSEVANQSRATKRPKGQKRSHDSSSAELDAMLAGLESSPAAPPPPPPAPRRLHLAPSAPPPPTAADEMENFFGSLEQPPVPSSNRRTRDARARPQPVQGNVVQGKPGKKGKQRDTKNLLVVGGLAAVALLLMAVGAFIFLRMGDSEDVAKADKQEQVSGDVPASTATNDEAAIAEDVAVEDPKAEIESPAVGTSADSAESSEKLELTVDPSQRALEICATGGDEVELKKLIAGGANLEETDTNGRTPLRLAVMGKDLPLIKVLLNAKAEVNTRDAGGETPLMSAAQHGDVKLVKLLIDSGADPNLATSGKRRGTTPLHVAARYGHTAVALLLIERSAKLDAQNPDGVSPLMVAAWNGHAATALALIEKGAETKSILDIVGQTPLMYAARGGNAEIVEAMLKAGADVGPKSKRGSTAVSIAESTPRTNAKVIAKLKQVAGEEAPVLDF